MSPSPFRRFAALVATFITLNVVGAAIALAMSPFVKPTLGPFLRDPAREGLYLPALLGGYFVIASTLALLSSWVPGGGALAGATLGLVVGASTFLGDHLVTAGWSTMPAGAMAAAGLFDSISAAAGGAMFAIVAGSRRGAA